MTEEQFEALVTMNRYIVDAAIAGREYGGLHGMQHHAVNANDMADKMISAAKALLVDAE